MSQHKMPPPVGIQMFATISSKHHFQTLQRDLRGLTTGARAHGCYEDTLVVCRDGTRTASRLILGLVLPELATATTFSLLPEVTILMPGHSTRDLDRMVAGLLASAEEEAQVMEAGAWPQNLNSLIDTLRPEAGGDPRLTQRPRMATLHSDVTRETVVLHAASNEDEADDDVLVVADDDHQDPREPLSLRSHRHSLTEPQAHEGLNQQPPVIRSLPGLSVHDNPPQPQALTSVVVNKVKPPTYVPIPSKKDKSKTTISPSVTGFTARHPQGLGLSPTNISSDLATSPKSRPLEIKPQSRTTPPIRVLQKPLREASTRVSRVGGHHEAVSPDLRPRTTEIRPVTSAMEVSPEASAPRPVFPCPICHERFLGQVYICRLFSYINFFPNRKFERIYFAHLMYFLGHHGDAHEAA